MLRKLFALIVIVASLSAVAPPQAQASQIVRFDPSQEDQQMHMLSTFGLTLSATMIMQSRRIPRWQAVLISSLAMMTFSVGKEVLFDPVYSQADMAANAIGTAAHALVVFTFQL